MYLSKIDENYLASVKEMVVSNHNYLETLTALNKGCYSIIYSFNQQNLTIHYEAFSKVSTVPYPYLSLQVDGSGAPLEEDDILTVHESYYPFLFYLATKEKRLAKENPAYFKKLYASCYSEMSGALALSPRELKERAEARSSFLDYVKKMEKNSTGEKAQEALAKSSPLRLEVGIDNDPFSSRRSFNLSLTIIKDEVSYPIRDLGAFFLVFSNKSFLVLKNRKNSLTLKGELSLFEASSQELLKYLLISCSGSTSYPGEININESQTIDVLYLLAKQSFRYNHILSRVNQEEKEGGVSLTPNGEPFFYPPLKRRDKFLAFSPRAIADYDPKKALVTLTPFKNASIAYLYSFFLDNGAKSFPYVKDLLKEYLLPVLGSTLIKEDNGGTEESLPFVISYYVDLTDAYELSFRSCYSLRGQPVEKEDVNNNLYYSSLLNAFMMALNGLGLPENGKVTDEEKILSFLKEDLTNLKKVATVYVSDVINRLNIVNNLKINVSLRGKAGYLEAGLGNNEYSEQELKTIMEAYHKKRRFVIVGQKVVLLSPKNLDPIDEVLKEVGAKEKKVPFFTGLKIAAKANSSLEVDMDEYFKKALENLKNFEQEPLELDQCFMKVIRPYQITGVKWMKVLSKYHLAGILADDMGLGKTLESIAFISTLQEKGPLLIVTPKSVLYNWQKEFNQWDPSLKCQVIDGSKEQREKMILSIDPSALVAYIISYDSLSLDLALYQKMHFTLLLLDEAQNIKNAYTKKSQAVKKIDASMRFALTGTPIENRLSDLWSIFDFLMPSFLGEEEDFLAKYEPSGQLEGLRTLVAPFLLRRDKQSVLVDLPKKTTSIISLTLDDKSRQFYEATVQQAKDLAKQGIHNITFLSLLTKLREICVDPGAFYEGFPDISNKLDYALNLVEEALASGHKILLFSAFRKVLDHFRNYLDAHKIASYCINGDTPSSSRLEIATSFNSEDDVRVLLVSLKAGGTGLNLQGADIVIHLDPWWNFAAEEQATDRAYRIGQKRPVSVYKLVAHDSVEEKVIELQKDKAALVKNVISEGEDAITHLSMDDIMYLLS